MAERQRALRRAAAQLLRPARTAMGRFVRPTFDERLGYLQATMDRSAAKLAGDTAALERRIAESIETLRQTTSADIATAIGDLASHVDHQLEDLRRQANEMASPWASELGSMRRALTLEIDRTRSRLAVPDSTVLELEWFRTTPEYALVFDKPDPLVSVIVPTYNRAELLVDRCLRSILDQDYSNFEILVVGDGCTDDTEARVRAIGDERISYVDFTDPLVPRGISFGTEASNAMLAAATGDLITHLDDDDEYAPDRLGKLVRHLKETKAELVWHPFWWQEVPGAEWAVNEAEAFEYAKVTTGSVLYVSWLKRFPWDTLAVRYKAPADWLLFRTMRDIGVRMVRYPEPLLRHYKEGLNPRWQDDPDSSDRHYPPGSRAGRSLLPVAASESEYEGLLRQLAPWVPAAKEAGRRAAIDVDGPLRSGRGGDYPTIVTAGGHVVKLFGPWWEGERSFDTELMAYRYMSRDTELATPRLVAYGTLTEEWRYIVTTLVPGDPLSVARAGMERAALHEVMRWIGSVVRRLEAVPLSDEERNEGADAFRRELSFRYGRLTQALAERGTLPARLVAQVPGWMPTLEELLPKDVPAVLLHGDIHDDHVLGSLSNGRFEPTGIIDFNRAQVGHPYRELGPLNRWVTLGDPSLMHAFAAEARWPHTDRPDFPRRALAYVLLNPADQLAGLPAVEEAQDLDDLAHRLFARPAAGDG